MESRERLRKVIRRYLIILGIGLAYLVFVRLAGFGIPCVFYELTGLKCGGCGISRMFIAISKLDFYAAFRYNPCIFVTLPFVLAYFVCNDVKYIRSGKKLSDKWNIFLIVEIVLIVSYGVLRNIFPI